MTLHLRDDLYPRVYDCDGNCCLILMEMGFVMPWKFLVQEPCLQLQPTATDPQLLQIRVPTPTMRLIARQQFAPSSWRNKDAGVVHRSRIPGLGPARPAALAYYGLFPELLTPWTTWNLFTETLYPGNRPWQPPSTLGHHGLQRPPKRHADHHRGRQPPPSFDRPHPDSWIAMTCFFHPAARRG